MTSDFRFGNLLAISVLALSFIAGQAISLQHLHSADEPVEHCLVCGHLDNTPAAGAPDLTVAPASGRVLQLTPQTLRSKAQLLRGYASRASPLS